MNISFKAIKIALIALGMAAFVPTVQAEYTDDCITFSSASSFTLQTWNISKNWDGTLWTSTDKKNWTEWNGALVTAAKTGSTYCLYVRGNTSNTKIAGYFGQYRWVLAGSNIACTGNIETLRGATGDDPSPTPMAKECYWYMFYDCEVLTTAPALPATTLAESCYCEMFSGCKSLTEAPALPATTLAMRCYEGMFKYCESLTVAPALPATTLANWCYEYMFKGCKSLTEAPALPATTLATACYYEMFSFCKALVSAPKLPATKLSGDCYQSMFMFCTSLEVNTEAPGKEWKIPASTTTRSWGTDMFWGTKGSLQGQPELNTTYYIKSALIDDCITFSSATSFTLQTENTSKNWDGTLWVSTNKVDWSEWDGTEVFAAQASGMYNLYVCGNAANTKISDGYYWMLTGSNIACTGNIETLRGATGDEPSPTAMADYCYGSIFRGCTALTSAPALPATKMADWCYSSMFSGCTSLTNAPALPATVLEVSCYRSMFTGCTLLKDAPALPATTLADYCYNGMFKDCTALEVNVAAPGNEWMIPVTSTTALDWGKDMFWGTAGTLTGQPALNTTYYIKSASAPGSEGKPWAIGAGKGDTVNAWTNGTTLVIQGTGKMMDFDTEDSTVPWPVEQIAAVDISGDVTSIGQNAWLGLDKSVKYNGLSAEAAMTMGNGFGGTTQYARTAFREFLVDGASINATVALETAKSLTNEWTEVELTDEDVHVENGRIVIQHESAPQSQGFYLLQPTE